jgi:hypothetical protein
VLIQQKAAKAFPCQGFIVSKRDLELGHVGMLPMS